MVRQYAGKITDNMSGRKTKVGSLLAKHRIIRRETGGRAAVVVPDSLIFSVSGDKCQARLNCYANTDSQIIPILVPSPSPSNTPIYTNIIS